MKLYRLIAGHIPLKLDDFVKPCVPHNRLENENDTIPRICTAKTLDGCLTAIGPAAIGLNALQEALSDIKQDMGPEHQVQIIEQLAFPYTILMFDLPDDAPYLVKTARVAQYVADAWRTQECWLIEDCRPVCISHVWLVNGTVGTDFLLCNGKKCTYCYIEGSVWSHTQKQVNSQFKSKIIMAAKNFLYQERTEKNEKPQANLSALFV